MEIIQTKDGAQTAYGWASGDRPGTPSFTHDVPERIRAAITSRFPGSEVRALTECRHIVGRYHVTWPELDVFVRISSLAGHPEIEKALVDHLRADEVSVNEFLSAGERIEFEDAWYRLDVRPFLLGRHELNGPADLESLAKTVAACHHSLNGFAESLRVKEIAEARFARLGEAAAELGRLVESRKWEDISPFADWSQQSAGFLAGAARGFDPRLPGASGAQCQHGQLHRANVIFRESDCQPVLLDFEESVHVFAPLEWDVSHLVQRFCLHDDPDRGTAAERIAVVEKSCGPVGPEVFEMMRQVAWFSLIILSDAWRENGLRASRGEYEKFVRLEEQARKYRRELAR